MSIPTSKEDPLFDREVTSAEVRSYLDARFADAGDRRCGTVTPQYMSSPDTAARMHAFVPDAHIVVLLRDPVARALSHYKMSVLRELEMRTFDAAVADQLLVLQRGDVPDLYSETDSYVVRGRYAWLLSGWYEAYGADRILTLWNDELDTATVDTVQRVQTFLGIDVQVPDDAEFRFNANPAPHRLSRLRKPVASGLRKVGWEHLDVERRERISSGIERTLARAVPSRRPGADASDDTVAALRGYYAADHTELTELAGCTPSWPAS